MRQPDFWTKRSTGAFLAAIPLAPLGWIYGATIAFRARISRPYRSRARVVCVGNLSVGGAGKTPVAMEIGRLLAARGARAVFLTRGYGGWVRGPTFFCAHDGATRGGG